MDIAGKPFIPIDDVMAKLGPKFNRRYVREAMSDLGFARKIGREYFTTPGEAQSFLRHVEENGLCKTGRRARTSNRTSGARRGTRGALSPSVTAIVSPERELKEALARIAGPKRRPRNSATT
jgi:hypothetical protein